jgi:hypothetical protein
MSHGPMIKLITRAVNVAQMVLKVMYRKTLRNE